MEQVTRYQRRRPRAAAREIPTAERQAQFLTFQILTVVVLLLLVWALKYFKLPQYGAVRNAGELLLSGDSKTSVAFDYDAIEDFLSGKFSLSIADVLAKLRPDSPGGSEPDLAPPAATEPAPTPTPAMGGVSKGLVPVNGTTPQTPGNASFSPLILSAQPKVPVSGPVTSYFGWRENPLAAGEVDFHTGLDIAAPEGTPIFAALPGRIKDTGFSESFGNYVHVEHPSGLVTTYSHCSAIIAKNGENIRQGERIALVGSTGNVTGAHLHFEIQKDAVCSDPLVQLRPDMSAV